MLASRFVSLLALALASVEATRVMHRPVNYKQAPNKLPTATHAEVHQVYARAATGKAQFAYFTNWGIYGANFQPTDIVSTDLTTILYSFADISADSGQVVLTDSYADEQKHYPGDSWDETGNNLYGCLKQLYLLKLKQRNLKVVLSVGGWTYSQNGHFNFVTDAGKRTTFINSAVQLIKDYGFDGIDLDFEFPANQAQGQGFADLVTGLRTAFTTLKNQKGDATPYLLSAAVSAGATNYAYLPVPQLNAALDYWNVMAYDYAGSWSNFTDNQANLYGPSLSGYSTDAAISWYLTKGATAAKINLGIPLYGRAFENTKGIGSPYNGIGPGTIEAGVYSYKTLPLAGATVYENSTDVTSYSYDASKQEFVSYDTPNIVKKKAQYVVAKGLAGSMFWELSTDKVGADSLVATSHSVYGALDQTLNHISFPDSKFDNLRKNFGSGSTTTTTTVPTTTTKTTTSTTTTKTTTSTTTTKTSTSPTATPTGGKCAGVAPWVSTTAYTGGQSATYGSHLWTAKWWTQGDTPGGAAGVWTDVSAC